jgi:hypothetical protein
MVPVTFNVVPSAVNTLLPAFRQVMEAADERLFRNGCELHCHSRLNSLDVQYEHFLFRNLNLYFMKYMLHLIGMDTTYIRLTNYIVHIY